MTRLALDWEALEPPREPAAVLATDGVVRHLATAALDRVRAGARLRVAFSTRTILVLGHADDLPWVDGVVYLGREGGVLLPTTATPSIPAELLRAALEVAFPEVEHAVLPGRLYTFPVPVLEPDPAWLARYAAGAS